MPPVVDILNRELDALEARRTAAQRELEELPRGYVSRKEIKGHDYYYLQHREGRSVKSQLIKQGALEPLLEALRRKQLLKQELREIEREQKQIRKLLKKEQKTPIFPRIKEKHT